MATSFATSQRQRRQRQRTRSTATTAAATTSATATATATATAIVQNVLEIGLATVLERRGAFPPEFFVHQALGGAGAGADGAEGGGGGGEGMRTTMAARFDEEWLRSRSRTRSWATGDSASSGSSGSSSSSSSSSSSVSSSNNGSGSNGNKGHHRTPNPIRQRQPSQTDDDDDGDDTTETECDAPLSTVGICTSAAGGGGTGDVMQSMVSQLLPPSSYCRSRAAGGSATGSRMESSSDGEEEESRTVGHDGSAISNGTNSSRDNNNVHDDEGDDRRLEQMRSEALLLLEWIRRGVVDGCWRRNLLSRVCVGVCIPAAAGGGHDGGPDGNDGGGGPARLVESYAFDLSTAADEVARLSQQQGSDMLGIGGGGGGRKMKNRHHHHHHHHQQQQQQLHSEEDVQAAVRQMLRGIRGYIDANYGHYQHDAAAARESSVVTQFTNFEELDDATTAPCYSYTAGSVGTAPSQGAATTTRTTLPRDRYFTFRVEFTKPISKAQLPPALNDQSEEFGTVPSLGRVLAGKDAMPNNSKSDGGDDGPAKQREPTADPRSLQRLGRWALGRVQPANGVSVGFHAFCEDPDDAGNLMVGDGDKSGGDGRDIFDDDDDDDDTVPTAELSLRENADPQQIFAPISTKAGSIKSNDPSQESSQSAPSIAIGQSVLAYPHKGTNIKADAVEEALSCTIVDTRVHNVHGRQYKVEFDGSCGLEHLKQWMSADRIVVITSPIGISGGDEEKKRKEADCSSEVEVGENAICRPKKRTRVVYRYIAKPIRFKL